MEDHGATEGFSGAPELTELGKRIEMLRIERGLSKQHLARHAGTSRQQLWRVMTGKSELTVGLRTRLAEVLQAPSFETAATTASGTMTFVARSTSAIDSSAASMASALQAPRDLASYLADPAAVRRTLASMPSDERGRTLKRRLLDAIEDQALAARLTLGRDFFDLRHEVLAGEL